VDQWSKYSLDSYLRRVAEGADLDNGLCPECVAAIPQIRKDMAGLEDLLRRL
jgi:hypothetical protein